MSGITARSTQPKEEDPGSGDQDPRTFLLPWRRPASSLIGGIERSTISAARLCSPSQLYCSRQEVAVSDPTLLSPV